MDSGLRSYFLFALGCDLAIADGCTPQIAEELVAGACWWDRARAEWGGAR